MFLFRKNIILVPSDYDGVCLTKGLINFDCYDGDTECTLRCYNLQEDKPLTFGVAVNGKLYKFQVPNEKTKNFDFKLPITIKNSDEISCVLLNVGRNGYNIVLWGSTQMNNAWKSTLKMMLEAEDDFANNIKSNVQNQSNENQYNEVQQSYNLQSNEIASAKTEVKSESAYENKSSIQSSVSVEDDALDRFIDRVIEITEKEESQNDLRLQQTDITQGVSSIDSGKQAQNITFYERIKPQLDKMFEVNQNETVLEEIIPSSKFCKVQFDDGSGYYVFGIIYDDGRPKYLCYGLPAQKNEKPPREMSELYQWFPIDANEASGDGFYMMYQDAATGKNISVDVI